MSGNRNPSNRNTNNGGSLDSAMIRDFLDVQKDKIALEKSELELKKQHIKNQADLAKQSLTIQEKLLEKAPKEKRKDRGQILLYVIFFTLIILGFSAFCLTYKYEKFLTYLIGTLSHLTALGLGYYFGTQKKGKDNNIQSDIEDAEVVE
jgi:hypothetical protein